MEAQKQFTRTLKEKSQDRQILSFSSMKPKDDKKYIHILNRIQKREVGGKRQRKKGGQSYADLLH